MATSCSRTAHHGTGCDQMALLELHRAGRLRDYYDGLVLDRAALERGLELGTIVVDRRLEDFMLAPALG